MEVKFVFRIQYRYPDVPSYPFQCISYNKIAGCWEVLLNDGTIINRLPTPQEESQVVKFSLDQREPWDPNQDSKIMSHRVYKDFEYCSEADEAKLPGAQKKANMIARILHGYIKTHENVIIRGKNGNNANPNLSTGFVELIDVGAKQRDIVERNLLVTEFSQLIGDMYQDSMKEMTFIVFLN